MAMAFPETPASWERHRGEQRPVQVHHEWYLEPRDPDLCLSSLFNVNVQVAGLPHGWGVWMCGADEALGSWDMSRALPLTRLEPLPRECADREQGQSDCIWWALVRLPAGRDIMYKYFVAPRVSSGADVHYEGAYALPLLR